MVEYLSKRGHGWVVCVCSNYYRHSNNTYANSSMVVNMIRVVILTDKDFAGSAYKIYLALKRYSRIQVQIFTGSYTTMFLQHNSDSYILNDLCKTQVAIDMADIVHIKGDWPAEVLERKFKIRIKHKPVVQTVSGSYFRKAEHNGRGTYSPEMYADCALRTSFEPDLLYPEYGGILTPYPIDTWNKENIWERQNPPVFVHVPSSKVTKHTFFIEAVFKEMESMIDFKVIIPRKPVSFKKSIEMRKQSTIYFDQFGVGAYGNAAVEMMAYGIPIGCFLSDHSLSCEDMKGHPVITTRKNITDWAEMIASIATSDKLEQISRDTKQWCEEKHSFKAVEQQWYELYKNIC